MTPKNNSSPVREFAAAVAAGILAVAATAFTDDAIDMGGKASIAIAKPAAAVVMTQARQVSMDSAGVFTAAVPAVVSEKAASAKAGGAQSLCLDSYCRTDLKM